MFPLVKDSRFATAVYHSPLRARSRYVPFVLHNTPQSDRHAIVFWGAAIVFFLAKFINFHNAEKQGFWVEVSSQVVNGKRTHLQSPDRSDVHPSPLQPCLLLQVLALYPSVLWIPTVSADV